GTLVYDLQLSGPVATGSASVFASDDAMGLRNGDMTARVDQLIGLNASVRQAGGTVRLRAVSFAVDRQWACIDASGDLGTDVLSNLGAGYGEDLPDVEGQIACSGTMLDVLLDGTSQSGISVDIDARVGVASASSLNARIGGARGEIAQALRALGFTRSGGDFVYVRELGP
ncbi:MAG: hypothetical protein AAF829_13330, partial [Pseudomonadota bacterium]